MSDPFPLRRGVLGGSSLVCLALVVAGPAAAQSVAQAAPKVSEVVVTARPYVAPSYVAPRACMLAIRSSGTVVTDIGVSRMAREPTGPRSARGTT